MHARTTWALAIVLAAGAFTTALAHEGTLSKFNFSDDVRPIFVEHCSGCHRPGGAGPMSLLTYSEAVPWANAVKMQVLQAQMPPWLPADGVGAFQHTRSLTADEIDVVIDWVIGQTPEGEPLTPDELEMEATPEWAMGTPDMVLKPEADVVIGEDDDELSRCLVLPTKTSEPRVASAFEVKPGLATIVRRATISLGESCGGTRPLATWLPGQGSASLAGGSGQELPAGASLAVELLYVKSWEDEGKRLTDRTEIGIRFSDSARPVRAMRVSEASYTFSEDVELLALYPEPAPGQPLRIEAVIPGRPGGPDGHAEAILVIDEFKAEWGEKYLLVEPLRLPLGTELRVSQPGVWIDFVASSAATAE